MKNIIRLNNGVEMPMIGFGTYQMPPSITERCVSDALTIGYRHMTRRSVTAMSAK